MHRVQSYINSSKYYFQARAFIFTDVIECRLGSGSIYRSEGFSRTGYLLPARGTPGVSPDGEGSWDAAAAVVAVTWKFRSTFWLGNYIWSLSLWNWALVEALDALRPGFCTEFRYLSYGQSGFAWGAIFEKIIKYQEKYIFSKMCMSKKSRNVIFQKKSRRRPNEERSR